MAEPIDHYTDDELTAYVGQMVPDREGMEAHFAVCPECRARLGELEQIEGGLRNPAVWREVDGMLAQPARLQETLKLKRSIEKENADAVRLLAPLVAAPIRFDEAKIAESPRFHTAGVVRMLCAEANGMHERRPRFSLRLADAACVIAALLPDDQPTVRYCRGLALRERANALRYLGQFTEALAALDEAETFFDTSPAGDAFDQAVVGYIRGAVLAEIERSAEALSVAEYSIQVFQDYGDERRELSARLLQSMVLHAMGRLSEAASTFDGVIVRARRLDERSMLAHALQGGAVTNLDLQAFDRAEQYLAEAQLLYDELGLLTESIRVKWTLGELAMSRGQLAAADPVLDSVRSELQRLGLRNDHALATLDWVEVRLALGHIDGVAKACREIIVQFDSEGMKRNARLALAHLHQALGKQTATPQLVRQIRAYLRDLPRHPSAAFVPHA